MSRAEPAFNERVHSASYKSNHQTILAELRLLRHHLIVLYDHAENLFSFVHTEHDRPVSNRNASLEAPLIEKFEIEVAKISKQAVDQRRFANKRSVNVRDVPFDVPGLRKFHPAHRRSRSLLDDYTPFDPDAPIDDEDGR